MATRRKKHREKCINFLGNKCSECGTNENLEIDHIDRKNKLFQLSGKGLDFCWDKIMIELHKCQLFCHECHLNKSYAVGDLKKAQHGSYRKYISGCRCNLCKTVPRDSARRYRKKRKKKCCDCEHMIDYRSTRCNSCALRKRHKKTGIGKIG